MIVKYWRTSDSSGPTPNGTVQAAEAGPLAAPLESRVEALEVQVKYLTEQLNEAMNVIDYHKLR